MKVVLTSALFILCGQGALAQRLDCRLTRQTGPGYAGNCVSGADTVISHLRLTPPSNPAVSVWRGSGLAGGRPLPIAVDVREGGTFLGGGWHDLSDFRRDAVALEFSFVLSAFTAATTTDVEILHRARDLLRDTTRWVAADDQPVWIAALVMAMPAAEDLAHSTERSPPSPPIPRSPRVVRWPRHRSARVLAEAFSARSTQRRWNPPGSTRMIDRRCMPSGHRYCWPESSSTRCSSSTISRPPQLSAFAPFLILQSSGRMKRSAARCNGVRDRRVGVIALGAPTRATGNRVAA